MLYLHAKKMYTKQRNRPKKRPKKWNCFKHTTLTELRTLKMKKALKICMLSLIKGWKGRGWGGGWGRWVGLVGTLQSTTTAKAL